MDLIERRFGKLLVLKVHSKGHSTFWKCQCDCGSLTTATTNQLTSGGKKSCGCLRKEITKTLRARTGGNTKPEGQGHFNKLYYSYKYDAKRRNLQFNLTKIEFKNIIDKDCHYCLSSPVTGFIEKKRNGSYLHNGIDRIASSIGYELNNCIPCCKRCNRMKWDTDYNDFISQCGVIYLNRRKNGPN